MHLVKYAAFTAALCAAAPAQAPAPKPASAPAPAPAAAAAPQSVDATPMARAFPLVGGGPQIGVSVSDPQAMDRAGGIIVDDVREGSPASKAGIKKGDRIVEFDGENVRSVAEFRRLVQETPDGRTVAIVVQRASERITLNVAPERPKGDWFDGGRFGYLPIPPAPPAAPIPPVPPRPRILPPELFDNFVYHSGDGRLGVLVENLTDQLREYFGVKHGVLVRSVTDASAAAKAGLKAGDVITAINGRRIEGPSEFMEELNRADDNSAFTLDISRDRKPQTLKGTLGRRGHDGRWGSWAS